MSAFSSLDIIDIRSQLARSAARFIGKRDGQAASATLHYNGPATALHAIATPTVDQEIAHFKRIAQMHLEKVWGHTKAGKPIRGDGIMYAIGVGPSGRIYLLRDLDDIRWHAANTTANETSPGVHLPLGGTQDATPAQWESATRVFDALIADNDLGGRSRKAVLGHREWPRSDGLTQSACPGPLLMRRLMAWREQKTILRYRTIVDANVRQGPGVNYPIAWLGEIPAGRVVTFDELKPGTTHGGISDWAHMLSGDGFVHLSCLTPEP